MNDFDINFDAANDENFFGRLANTNLEQLFGIQTQQTVQNESLKYQPIKSAENQAPPAAATTTTASNVAPENWELKFVKVVHVYKEHAPIGKAGVAVYGNQPHLWRILIYKKKENVLAQVTSTVRRVMSSFQVRDGYWQFYDDNRIYWSVRFESPSDEEEFCKTVQLFDIEIKLCQDSVTEISKKNNKGSEAAQLAEVEKKLEELTTSAEEDGGNVINVYKTGTRSIPTKTEMISRLSKVGQKLPSLPSKSSRQINAENYDSDAEVMSVDSAQMMLHEKPLVMPRTSRGQQPLTTVTQCMEVLNQMETHYLRLMLTESRTQNTELRINIEKLHEKMETMCEKVNSLKVEDLGEKLKKDDEIIKLEEKVLNLKKENRELQLQVKETQINQEKDNCTELCQRIASNHGETLKQLGVEVKEELKGEHLEKLIADILIKIKELQTSSTQQKSECSLLAEQLQKSKQALKTELENHSSTTAKLTDMEEKIKSLESTVELKEKEITSLHKQQKVLEAQQMEQLDQQRSQTEYAIKVIMNRLMEELSSKIDSLEDLEPNRVKSLIGKTIRDETLKSLAEMKQ